MLVVKTYLGKSNINGAGIGLFANEDISEGTIVWQFCPPFDFEFTLEEILQYPEAILQQMYHYGYYYDARQRFVFCGDDGRYMNHEEQPSCLDEEAPNSFEHGVARATRDLKIGDEITCNYHIIGCPTAFHYRPSSFAEALIYRANHGAWPTGKLAHSL